MNRIGSRDSSESRMCSFRTANLRYVRRRTSTLTPLPLWPIDLHLPHGLRDAIPQVFQSDSHLERIGVSHGGESLVHPSEQPPQVRQHPLRECGIVSHKRVS